jgi:predicted RNase H-like HicB family nuclease
MKTAHYEILADDGTFYGDIPECRGVYANATTLEECREELAQTLEDWILVSVAKNLPLPVVDGIELAVRDVA